MSQGARDFNEIMWRNEVVGLLRRIAIAVERSEPAEGLDALRAAVGRYVVAVTRRANGRSSDEEVEAAYAAMLDTASGPGENGYTEALARLRSETPEAKR